MQPAGFGPGSDDDAGAEALPRVSRAALSESAYAATPQDVGISAASFQAAAELDAASGAAEGAGDPALQDAAPKRAVSGLEQFDALPQDADRIEVHGSAVALGGRAVLIVGRSGAGKSALALSLMALGAELVADDRVVIERMGNDLKLKAVSGFEGLIEARGIGILQTSAARDATLCVIVDLDQTELHRLPPARAHEILTKQVHLVYGRENWSLEPALLALLAGRIVAPQDR